MNKLCLSLLIALLVFSTKIASASESERVERNLHSALKTGERIRSDRERENMRDKTHDNRLMLDRSTSIGVGRDNGNTTVNIRHSID